MILPHSLSWIYSLSSEIPLTRSHIPVSLKWISNTPTCTVHAFYWESSFSDSGDDMWWHPEKNPHTFFIIFFFLEIDVQKALITRHKFRFYSARFEKKTLNKRNIYLTWAKGNILIEFKIPSGVTTRGICKKMNSSGFCFAVGSPRLRWRLQLEIR